MADTIHIVWEGLELLLAIGLGLTYTAACLILRFAQSRFIFFPSRQLKATPAEFNLPYQEVWLPVQTETGILEQVHGWWIPSSCSSGAERVILDFHGNRSNISANLDYAQQFHQMGLSVFLIDYRGYGRSTKRIPSEKTVYQDVEAAWNYLIQKRKINPHHIFVFGHSLGGAIGIHLASKHPEIAGIIVESSFTSLRRMVDYRKKYWIFPVDLLLIQKFNSIDKVPHLKMPILFTHGTQDRVIPVEMSQELFRAAIEPKQLLIIPGADHNNVRQVGGTLYQDTLRRFLQQHNSKSC